MIKKILFNISIALPIAFSSVNAQDADPIEAARQAKLAAEKAAADAEAATGAAIEAAAAKAAAAAREKVIADRRAEEARKIAEKEAAENAEIDAAAEAAALEARRKLAAELGLEIEEVPDSTVKAELQLEEEGELEEEKLSPLSGFNIGVAPSFGILSGKTFTGIPVGATAVITTPYGFNVGPLKYTISLAAGSYLGEFEDNSFDPIVLGIGGNLTLLDFVFAEGHIGNVGDGLGIRGFAGVSLERIMKKGLEIPFNILIGSELFISNDMAGVGNASGWLSVGARLDYGF